MKVGGRGNFNFNAKNNNGKQTTDGNTTFHVNVENMNFRSSLNTPMSLVVSGHKATYTGEGTINGSGAYEIRVIAIDGDLKGPGNPDHFRIKIWEKGRPSAVVYDNEYGIAENVDPTSANTVLGGGSNVIHQLKGSSTSKLITEVKPKLEQPATKFQNYPNPYNDRTTITFSSVKEESIALEVYDVKGSLVKKVDMGVTEAGKTYSYELESRNMPEGMYFARLITPSGVQTIKMVLKRKYQVLSFLFEEV